jgi:hypothetical protein
VAPSSRGPVACHALAAPAHETCVGTCACKGNELRKGLLETKPRSVVKPICAHQVCCVRGMHNGRCGVRARRPPPLCVQFTYSSTLNHTLWIAQLEAIPEPSLATCQYLELSLAPAIPQHGRPRDRLEAAAVGGRDQSYGELCIPFAGDASQSCRWPCSGGSGGGPWRRECPHVSGLELMHIVCSNCG